MRLQGLKAPTSNCLHQFRLHSSRHQAQCNISTGSILQRHDFATLSRVPCLILASRISSIDSSRRQQRPLPPISPRQFHIPRRNLSTGPSLGAPGPKDGDEKVPAITAFEIPTLNNFLGAATSGIMPGGETTTLSLFPSEAMKCLSEPYKDWAPEPFSKIPGPAGPFGAHTGTSPPPMIRMMHVLSGLDSILEDAFSSTAPLTVERSFKVMKTKIWFGMAPMTEARWKSKGLDEQENIEEALAIIEQVIDVWKHLCTPRIQGDIRSVHNKMWTEIDVFQDAVTALAASRGETLGYNFTLLWHEYIRCHFEHMQLQSRSWLYTHLKTLQKIWKDRFVSVMASGRQVSQTHGTIRIDHYAMMILNKIQDIYMDADIYVRQRLEGFIMADRRIDERLSQIEAPKAQLNAAYAGIFAEMEGKMRGVMKQVLDARIAERHRVMPTPDFLEGASLVTDREFVHKSLSYEIDAPPEGKVEDWVRVRMDDKIEEFGFVVYRLCYSGSDEEWGEMVKRIEEGINSGWEGIVGADKIKGKARLHWIDGREEKIAEGNLDGARNDFQTIITLDSFPTNLSKTICLAITPTSLSSFNPTSSDSSLPPLFDTTSPSSSNETKTPLATAGDFRPFLHAIDASFSPPPTSPSPSNPSTSQPRNRKFPPNYKGTFPILDQLIYPDLLGLASKGVTMEDMWALGLCHPWGVYIGPTNWVRRKEFREMREGMGILLEKGKEGGCVTS